jgi:steroid delta-isomerase-like uncharacterized protein
VSTEESVAIVKKLYDLWNDRDLDGALELATDDVEVRMVALGQTLTGREGFRRFMERFVIASSDMKKDVTNQIASGDQVVSEFTLKGTHDGSLRTQAGEISPTGRSIELQVVEVVSIRDGKVASITNYSDTSTLMRQLDRLEGQVPRAR